MLIRKIAVVVMVLMFAAGLYARPGAPTTMTTTLEDGTEVNLLPDSTWSYVRPGILTTPTDDVFITLRDNRILWLKPDYTWTFTKTQPKANRHRDYQAVTVTGTATHRDLNAALTTATEDAHKRVAAALRRFVPANARNGQAFLLACVKNEVKEHDIETNHSKVAAGWKFDAKIVLHAHRVQKIVECLDVQLEQPPQ